MHFHSSLVQLLITTTTFLFIGTNSQCTTCPGDPTSVECITFYTQCTTVTVPTVDSDAISPPLIEEWLAHVQASGQCPGTRVDNFYNFLNDTTTILRLYNWVRTRRVVANANATSTTATFSANTFMADFTEQEREDSLGDLPVFEPTVSPTCRPKKKSSSGKGKSRRRSRRRSRSSRGGNWYWSTTSQPDDCEDGHRRLQEENSCRQIVFSAATGGFVSDGFSHAVDVIPVKSQGSTCGACWAFSATGSLENTLYYQNGLLIEPSEAQVLDCSNAGTCAGGIAQNGLQYIADNGGICSTASYGRVYDQVQRACATTCSPIPESNPSQLLCFDASPSQLELALRFGVPTISMMAPRRLFSYVSGIFECRADDDFIGGHAMIVVGHGVDSATGKSYFTVKNTWTQCWGENGYARIDRATADNCEFFTRRQSVVPDFDGVGTGGTGTAPTVTVGESQCRVYVQGGGGEREEFDIGTYDLNVQGSATSSATMISVAGEACCRAVVMFDGVQGENLYVGVGQSSKIDGGASRLRVACDERTESPTSRPTVRPTVNPSWAPSARPTKKPTLDRCSAVLKYLAEDYRWKKQSKSCRRLVCNVSGDDDGEYYQMQKRCKRKERLVHRRCVVKMGYKYHPYVCACVKRLDELQDVFQCGW